MVLDEHFYGSDSQTNESIAGLSDKEKEFIFSEEGVKVHPFWEEARELAKEILTDMGESILLEKLVYM